MARSPARALIFLGKKRFAGQRVAAGVFLFLLAAAPTVSSREPATGGGPDLGAIRSYIASAWDSLTRSMSDCKSIVDPKVPTPSVLYLPGDSEIPATVRQLEKQCNVQAQRLPMVIHHLGEADPRDITPPGLLYLPNKYVVPGGRFNEMYGWDSYFIIRGLLGDNRSDLAQGMVENFFFEIEHYGAVLNANRTYYLTRSQPPFLSSMILAVYQARKAAGLEDRAWLAKAYDYACKDYALWTHAPHLADGTGLSRYFDFGSGPALESLKDETGHYRQVAAFFMSQPDRGRNEVVAKSSAPASPPLMGPLFALEVCDTATTRKGAHCNSAGMIALSADYYQGDRSMRESGFDVSFRFGPHGARTHRFAPVCLNSLLYKTEKDLQQISEILGRKSDAEDWRKRAEERKERIQKYMWDEARGLYFDYDLDKQERSSYRYVTTFYPLWVGIATGEQARALMRHLSTFERPGGLVTSPYKTGGQWDYPYAWAPTQLLAIEGMGRYGFKADGDRISYKFLSTVAENFRRDGTIREKYNAVRRSSETQVTAGYAANVVGFGWTNGVFLELLRQLPPNLVERLAREQSRPAEGQF